MTCPSLASGDLFLSSLLAHLDCQAETLGTAGYAALSAPGSPASLALTSALILFVALYGLRLALGMETAPVRGSVPIAIRVGVVLTLAASWPAFQVVVHDVVVRGPEQLAALMVPPDGQSVGRGLIADLQAADQAIVQLTNLGTGRIEFSALPVPGAAPTDPPQRIPISDNPAFGWARVLFLSSAIAGFAVTRLMAGLLLALAPVFAGLLLFEVTRGLFIGWARALAFTLLASLALTLILTAEVRLLLPWLEQLIIQRQARVITASAPIELLVLCLSFAIALAGALALLLRASFMTHAPLAPLREILGKFVHATERVAPRMAPAPGAAADAPPSRALVIADAVAASQRREAVRRTAVIRPAALSATGSQRPALPSGSTEDLVIPDFRSAGRRARTRTSLGARLRDGRK